MRCPKCHYLSFDPDPRCRNCGYDLDVETPDDEAGELDLKMAPAAAIPAATPDLPLRAVEASSGKSVTLELVRSVSNSVVREPEPIQPEPALALVGVAEEPVSAPVRRTPARSVQPTTELPLFVKTMGPQEMGAFAGLVEDRLVGVDDPDESEEVERAELDPAEEAREPEPAPVVHVPATTRPLSVRRPFAEAPRTAVPQRRPGPLDNDLLEDLQRLEREEAFRPGRRPSVHTVRTPRVSDDGSAFELEEATGEVTASQRAGAAAFDGLLLGGVGAFVLWATLRVAGVSPSALGLASLLPMGVFLAGVGVAYLLMFTAAGGQTVGKMLVGIRVVGDESSGDDRVTLGQAASRAVLAPLSVIALGLGWLPALIGRGPALHDRLAHTRVVRA
ncbi:MAG TPA: RDD family protein [Vicinamibacterales bacterium]|nr:RDD family protein [Vicinamibacterales bacterium]